MVGTLSYRESYYMCSYSLYPFRPIFTGGAMCLHPWFSIWSHRYAAARRPIYSKPALHESSLWVLIVRKHSRMVQQLSEHGMTDCTVDSHCTCAVNILRTILRLELEHSIPGHDGCGIPKPIPRQRTECRYVITSWKLSLNAYEGFDAKSCYSFIYPSFCLQSFQ